MTHQSMQNGESYIEEIDMILKDGDMISLMVLTTLDGQVQQTMEGVFTRIHKSTNTHPGR
jgi:hypothetical protein